MPATYGTEGNDILYGDPFGPSHDRIYGLGGYDTIHGYAWSDCLIGGPGADWMHGYANRDKLFGELGADTLYSGDADDEIYGDGAQAIPQEAGQPPANVDLLDGGAGTDHLVGGYGPDELYGGPGGGDFCRGGPDGDGVDDPPGPATEWQDKYYGCEVINDD